MVSMMDILPGAVPLIGDVRQSGPSPEGVAVRYLGATFAPADQYCFCLFTGPSPAAVQEANARAEFPFARIVPAVQIAPEDL
jgi:hypothetical protein